MGAGLLAELFTWRAAFISTGVASIVLAFALRRLPEPVRDKGSRSVFARWQRCSVRAWAASCC